MLRVLGPCRRDDAGKGRGHRGGDRGPPAALHKLNEQGWVHALERRAAGTQLQQHDGKGVHVCMGRRGRGAVRSQCRCTRAVCSWWAQEVRSPSQRCSACTQASRGKGAKPRLIEAAALIPYLQPASCEPGGLQVSQEVHMHRRLLRMPQPLLAPLLACAPSW